MKVVMMSVKNYVDLLSPFGQIVEKHGTKYRIKLMTVFWANNALGSGLRSHIVL